MPNNSKAKGNKWENNCCKLFNSVFNLSFKRVPTSGAMTGGANADILALLSESQKLLLRGDIIVPDELNKIVIECKSRKAFPYHQLLESCKELNDWIEQVDHDLNEPDLLGLIILKVNFKTPWICYDSKWCMYDPNNRDNCMYHSLTHIQYQYQDRTFIIEPFNTEWIERNKDFLLYICNLKKRVND